MQGATGRRRAVVLGFDAMTWELYERIRGQGYLRGLERLLSRGDSVRGSIRMVPPYTAPMWTSITSGVNPGKHGIYGFFKVNRLGVEERLNTSLDVGAPRLHNMVSYSGGKSLVAGLIYTSRPFVRFNGIHIPEKFLVERGARPESVDRVLRSALDYYKESVSDGGVMCSLLTYEYAASTAIVEGRLLDEDLDLVVAIFYFVDVIMHRNPDMLYNIDRYPCVREAVKAIDRMVDYMLERSMGEDLILVVSDHGTSEVEHAILLNKLLQDEGYIRGVKWEYDEARDIELRRLDKQHGAVERRLILLLSRAFEAVAKVPGIGGVAYSLGRRVARRSMVAGKAARLVRKPKPDPSASIAYYTPTAFGSIYVNEDLADPSTVVPRLVRLLREFDERHGGRLFEVVEEARGKIFWGPYTGTAPHIMVVPRRGYMLSASLTGRGYIAQPSIAGNHYSSNMHIVSAPDPEVLELAGLIEEPWDYANLVLAHLGLPIPHNADGRVAEAARPRVGSRNYLTRYMLQLRVLRGRGS